VAFVSELFDALRDLTNDAADTQVPFATKKLYINNGIRRMWPQVWRVQEEALVLNTARDYPLSAATSAGHILSVRIETGDVTAEYVPFSEYYIAQGDEDTVASILTLTGPLPTPLGLRLKVRYAATVPLIAAASYAASQSETWTGPDRAMAIPVYYAMAMIAARKIDDRQDTLRYSTTQATNGVEDQDVMSASQMWMGQFELELASLDRPLPISQD